MPRNSLESRIEKLEQQVAHLIANGTSCPSTSAEPTQDWRSVIGSMNGPGMKEVLDEALKIREQHRKDFYEKQSQRRNAAKRRKVAS